MKNTLRVKYIKIRKKIKFKYFRSYIMYKKIIKNKNYIKSDVVLVYVSLKNEVNTRLLIKKILKHKKVAVPKIINNTMNFYYINSLKDLKKGYFGILEPITSNLVNVNKNMICITPGICFSKQGYRIGYGKGFYDKFFSNNNVYSIGLCFKRCFINSIPNDIYDKKVNEVITE